MVRIEKPFIINNRKYSKEELLHLSSESSNNDEIGDQEKKLFQFIRDFLEGNSPIIQKTSGTTGDPKTILLQQKSMIRSAEMTLHHFNLRAGNKALLCLPVEYIAGKMMVVRALVGGLHLLTVEPSGNPLESIDSNIDFTAMVPLQVFEAIKTPDAFKKIGKLIIGGGEISEQLVNRLRKIHGTEIYETFAMSETYSHFATKKLNGPHPEELFTLMEGVKAKVDTRGCLTVTIPGITNGWTVSNDLVEITENRSLRWLGRIDNVIKSGGIKIIPEILEKKIAGIIGRDVLILGVPDEKLGQKLVMIAEKEEVEDQTKMWLNKIKHELANHEVPKAILSIPQFPRNSSMKIDRKKVKELYIV